MIETIPHDDNDEISLFLLHWDNLELEHNKTANELEFIDVEYTKVHDLYGTMDVPSPLSINFELVEVE